MRILIETSGGGGIVLVVIAALLASAHGGGLDAALAAVLIALAIVIALALATIATVLVHRARHSRPAVTWQPRTVPPRRHSAVQPGTRAAIEPAAVRELHQHGIDAEQVAEILRRYERPGGYS